MKQGSSGGAAVPGGRAAAVAGTAASPELRTNRVSAESGHAPGAATGIAAARTKRPKGAGRLQTHVFEWRAVGGMGGGADAPVECECGVRVAGAAARRGSVACGQRFSAAIASCGRCVVAWGDGRRGQLGAELPESSAIATVRVSEACPGRVVSAVSRLSCGWSHAVATVRLEGRASPAAVAWGRNDMGQCGGAVGGHPRELAAPSGSPLLAAHAGSETTALLTSDGLWQAGWNEHGNLARPCGPVAGLPLSATFLKAALPGKPCGGVFGGASVVAGVLDSDLAGPRSPTQGAACAIGCGSAARVRDSCGALPRGEL